jgi:hypothetical protein
VHTFAKSVSLVDNPVSVKVVAAHSEREEASLGVNTSAVGMSKHRFLLALPETPDHPNGAVYFVEVPPEAMQHFMSLPGVRKE